MLVWWSIRLSKVVVFVPYILRLHLLTINWSNCWKRRIPKHSLCKQRKENQINSVISVLSRKYYNWKSLKCWPIKWRKFKEANPLNLTCISSSANWTLNNEHWSNVSLMVQVGGYLNSNLLIKIVDLQSLYEICKSSYN